jgi:endonuclease G
MRIILLILCALFCNQYLQAQAPIGELRELEMQLEDLEKEKIKILSKIEDVKLDRLREDLNTIGLPAIAADEKVISHSAMSLVYSEKHEQAKWVAHIISPEILTGQVSRTNDFRVDPKILTGSAVEEDYFLKFLQPNGEFKYDGFGYDRGHLAPSADFRWSQKALSESYFYSNMSPQLGDFNREIWAELEGAIRGYLYRNTDTQLYVCTGGVLTDDLPVVERGVNKVSIPQQYWKVVIDKKNQRGIGFLIPNKKANYPIEHFAKSINEIEELTGINFFEGLTDEIEEKVESQTDKAPWITGVAKGDVEPVPSNSLPVRHYNTVMAKKLMGNTGNKVTVVGQAVGGRYSRKGNILINLDKQYPNQIFTIFIRKEDIANFPYDPVKALKGKLLYVSGAVAKMGQTPCIYLKTPENLTIID